MNVFGISALKCILAVAIVTTGLAFDASASKFKNEGANIDRDMLSSVMSLYGLSEQEAIERYIAEEEAADLYRHIQSLSIRGSAGAWFNAETARLHVALSDPSHANRLIDLGAKVEIVPWSLEDFDRLASTLLNKDDISELWERIYVDYRKNRLAVGVKPERIKQAKILLDEYADMVDIFTVLGEIQETADVRGADGTRNSTWESTYGGEWPCSIGFPTEIGFYTAGHCNTASNTIATVAGAALGVTRISAMPYILYGSQGDTSWVAVGLGWSPSSKINGYSDGLLNVPAKWAGTNTSPIGTTVCRYGQTSGGPHCGTVNQFNVTEKRYPGPGMSYYISGLTEVSGSCTNDGDSGGPWLSFGGRQAQGINYGGTVGNTCPTATTHTYFQPIKDFITQYENHLTDPAGSLITTHGAATPSINGVFLCPDMNMSGMGTYNCSYQDYNSQGTTSVTWSGGVSFSSETDAFGTCSSGSTAVVTLTITNPYGSLVETRSFPCPMGPIP